ncbi:bifunctional pyr operon transcriptional regulator/uracil phosphoribosyltransferase PyrR [Thiorhodospira sibirica]|uniref:bifunctional pyr operon transcriptional regulator/uracil phosphoribosyltransferase PyrR n=1 Tax=Thiorhodospira sibirica TaxID=154347 RepID=UPI00022C04F1|nr:bifunctional pyr operon transcriptional regulator/uracil phosphoribosyltransferase PyrR [Thiorhodospira sibirica]
MTNPPVFDVPALLEQMSRALATRIKSYPTPPAMVGIHTGGVWVAQHLHQRLGLDKPLGLLDIAFYRDDFSHMGLHPQVRPSQLPFEVDDQHLILVDDVLYSGRTIRAALNELFDYGRPASVTLAVLVARDGRELPIEAQVVGTQIQLLDSQHIKLRGPAPLRLELLSTNLAAD